MPAMLRRHSTLPGLTGIWMAAAVEHAWDQLLGLMLGVLHSTLAGMLMANCPRQLIPAGALAK
jgi:hypothetical protein